MKKGLKITIVVILIIVLILGYRVYRVLNGLSEPNVPIKDKNEIEIYVENYLTNKYGDHKFKVTGVNYEYHMTTLFDYSNPVGYWVYFKCDLVNHSWVVIDGLVSDNYKISNDYFIESYYFPEENGYDLQQKNIAMIPRKAIEIDLLNELKEEFEPNVYQVQTETVVLNIPDDYGKMPTLEELKTDTSLYEIRSFNYTVSNEIEEKEEYKNRLKTYIDNKYNCDSHIYFNRDESISIYL